MATFIFRETALYYCVEDIRGANVTGARLQQILEHLRQGKKITQMSLKFLQRQGLEALHLLSIGSLSYDRFRDAAINEQTLRIKSIAAAKLTHEAEELTRQVDMEKRIKIFFEQAESARLARERDPKHIARIKNKELRNKYGVDTFIEQNCFGRLMSVLKNVDAGLRFSQEDFVWLSSVGKDYFSTKLQTAYHQLEAEFFRNEYNKTRNIWMAVNASGHFRKCNSAHDAESILSNINIEQQKSNKIKAALYTTRGGVMRDMKRWNEALHFGEKAHAIKDEDFRSCTLIGAIHMETGNYSLGQEWYTKAVKRGATIDSVDQDIRKIYFRADISSRARMRDFLLSENSIRFAWVK
jgi:tetratricopeptide (TPR) repeat protein